MCTRLHTLTCRTLFLLAPLLAWPCAWAQAPAAAPTADKPAPAAAPWADPIDLAEAIPTIPYNQADAFIDREVFAVGRIARVGRSNTGHVFLNFSPRRGSLTLFIHQQYAGHFPKPPAEMYRDKIIKVHGFIYDFKGSPNLSVTGPEQITILPDDATLPEPIDHAAGPAVAWKPPADNTITIATFNILNLFDAFDDPYRADAPGDAKPRSQIEALAKTIRALNADVIALEEVENRGYLERFVSAFLKDMGYEVVLFEGNDNRGIDVALLSRIPVGPVTSHRHMTFTDPKGDPMRFRRDLLEVRLLPPGKPPFEVFVVHLKSKSGEDNGAADVRIGEARAVRAVLDQQLKQDPKAAFVLCGDFNDTIDSEPLRAILGTGPTALKPFIADLPADQQISYNQEPHLSMIDFILASPAMADRYVPKSYRIHTGGSPDTTGSDHNPVTARFRLE